MTDSTDTFHLVSYNCRGWNSGIGLLRDIAPEFDLCMIQEHWLFAQQIGLLNFDHAFTSCGISGMDDGVLLKRRPFGGWGFIFRKIFLHNIKIIKLHFKHFYAILLQLILLICVYPPTDYH